MKFQKFETYNKWQWVAMGDGVELSLSIIIIVTLSIIHFFNFDSIILKVQKSISLTVQTQQTNQKNSL